MAWLRQFFSSDNDTVHSGIVLASVGAVLCFALVVYYAFWLQKPIDPATAALAGGGTGLGGAVGSAASWVGRAAKSILPAADDPDKGK